MQNAFTVMPMSSSLELKPGETYEGYIVVANPDNATSDFNFLVEVMPYGVIGDDYKADLTSSSKNTELTNWVKVSNPTGTVKPNESARVEYTITIPEDAAGGGQYAALVISSADGRNATDGLGVNNIYSIASLLYASIDGEVTHAGEVIENSLPGFVLNLPTNTNVMLKNDGNVHETANIYLQIKNILNGEIIYPKEGDTGGIQEEIMPGTTRYLQKTIQDISPLGFYEVTQTIDYLGENNVVSQVMVACPIWFMFLVFVTVCSIISYIITRMLKRKKTKE